VGERRASQVNNKQATKVRSAAAALASNNGAAYVCRIDFGRKLGERAPDGFLVLEGGGP
jgi:hypothetical protein